MHAYGQAGVTRLIGARAWFPLALDFLRYRELCGPRADRMRARFETSPGVPRKAEHPNCVGHS